MARKGHGDGTAQANARASRTAAAQLPSDARDSAPATSEATAIEEAESSTAPSDRPWRRWAAWEERMLTVLAVSAGGTLGACGRYAVSQWAEIQWGGAFPWGALLINLTGSLVLACFLTLATERLAVSSAMRLFIATGFLGAFTTFSTFSYETVQLIQHGHTVRAVAYLIASIVGGLAAALAGVSLAAAMNRAS